MHDVFQLRSGGTCTPFTGPTFQLNQYRNAQFLNSIIHIRIFIEFLNVLNMVSIWSSSKVSIWQRRPCRLPVLPMQCNAMQCNATDQFEEVSSCCQYPDYNTSLDRTELFSIETSRTPSNIRGSCTDSLLCCLYWSQIIPPTDRN